MTRRCWNCGGLRRVEGRDDKYLRLLADPAELTVRQIGERLGLAEQTAKNQLGDLYTHLGVRGRVGAVLKAIEMGLVETPRS